MTAGNSLADNLARIRKSRDMSQQALAEAASVGVDTVARIEQGTRTSSRPATLRKLAAALGVSMGTLLGHMPGERNADLDIGPLRHAIILAADIPGLTDFAESDETVSLAELGHAAHRAWRAYVGGRHVELLQALPVLLVDGRRLVRESDGATKARAFRLLSTTYRLGAGTAGRMGFDDLAWSSAERALDAARCADTPELDTAISLRYLAWTLLRQGRLAEAERVAVTAAERIQPAMLDRDPARSGVFGNLLFNAATAALGAGSPNRAEDLLAEAQAAAVRAKTDTASEAAIFGPRVAASQQVERAARAGDPEEALRLASTVPEATSEVPAFWEAGHRIYLAAASAELRRDRQALAYLSEARDLAADWVKHQPLGTSVMRRLVERAPRRLGTRFARLARDFGVVPA